MDRGTNGKENSTREEAMGKGMRFQDLEHSLWQAAQQADIRNQENQSSGQQPLAQQIVNERRF